MVQRDGLTEVFSEEQIRQRVGELGREISRDYQGRVPVLVSILKGSVIFLADLIRCITIPVIVDYMAITSFASGGGTGVVRILKDLDLPVTGRPVLIVEGIIDTGLTAGYLVKTLQAREPESLHLCTLLNRKVRRLVDLPLAYMGFEVPDQFLIGYGLDFQQLYRNLPNIALLPQEEMPGT